MVPCIVPIKRKPAAAGPEEGYTRGDSVEVLPKGEIGIVVRPADQTGNVLVQVKREKRLVNQKRLKLKVRASELYPEDYDFPSCLTAWRTAKPDIRWSENMWETWRCGRKNSRPYTPMEDDALYSVGVIFLYFLKHLLK